MKRGVCEKRVKLINNLFSKKFFVFLLLGIFLMIVFGGSVEAGIATLLSYKTMN